MRWRTLRLWFLLNCVYFSAFFRPFLFFYILFLPFLPFLPFLSFLYSFPLFNSSLPFIVLLYPFIPSFYSLLSFFNCLLPYFAFYYSSIIYFLFFYSYKAFFSSLSLYIPFTFCSCPCSYSLVISFTLAPVSLPFFISLLYLLLFLFMCSRCSDLIFWCVNLSVVCFLNV